ncbi:MAG: hypothetical protein IR158_05670 [Cellulomonas sp.]|uniref:Rv3235 family protein n=1 Tax=Cellulomonas sp. TaxID=40001 RepID=UPI001A05A8FF|nr:Rv3235 family protein [Cellulomonas sp.]MBF0687244.1 hypothetical protein [Cellulomonas sp.]
MTTRPHDDVAASALEDAVALLDRAAPSAPHGRTERRLAAVPTPTALVADDTVGRRAQRGARLRLVRALPAAPTLADPGPGMPPLLRERVRHLEASAPLRVPEPEDDRGAVPGTDAGRFAHGVGLACVEVVLGRRPSPQLARWVAPDVLESLQESADLIRRAGVLTHSRRPAARRVRVCPIDRHTAEACLVVDDGVRVRAVALRLQAHRGAWRVTRLEIG